MFRLIGDATAQPQALQNEEVQIISPQPNPDLLAQLEGIDGVTVEDFGSFTFEHFDFNFQRPLFQDKAVRQAFAYCVAAPGDRRHAHQAARTRTPSSSTTASTTPSRRATTTPPTASTTRSTSPRPSQALEAAGWTLQGDVYTKGDLKTEFSIGHIDPNPRRTNTVQLTTRRAPRPA